MFHFWGMAGDYSLKPTTRAAGRGAQSNRVGRFETHDRTFEDDGWDLLEDEAVLRTEVSLEEPRSMINYNRSPDLPFDRSINPYRGCEHGCVYCFARPTHAYLGLSPGLDFETRLIARPGAARVLTAELRKPGYRVRPLAIGTNTDPYQPIEKSHGIMRECLEVLQAFNHPVAIVTKGAMIERDIDILSEMAGRGLVRVGISVTTLDAGLSRLLEPRSPAPARRLAAIRRLSDAGVPVRIMTSPIIPALTDPELESLLQAGADAGASAATWVMLRLPLEVSPLFQEWLAEHYPNRAPRVMSLIRDMHGGKDYEAEWGRRMRGSGPYAKMIAHRFDLATRRLGLNQEQPRLRCDLFAVPLDDGAQMSLFR